ncbi:MAG: HAMP domain-containing histidine kinase, partial [Bacteroidetes bacterium]|nr:HAMP domain-containing histidine kinase [Bacteroidota bacterium]
ANMGQLSAGIAHELNNPLGVITMYSNILLDELPTEDPMRSDLELISEQANRCKKIVGGLLNFARKNQVSLSETDMLAFVKRSLDSIIHPKNIEIVFNHKVTDPTAFVDNDQMMQALTNLEKNAVEAMPEGGRLSVELSDNETEIIIRISDSGTGIAPEHMEKIFTPFFTTKELGKGTGLGLPLVYGIVKMHRGKIDVVSNADKSKGRTGTTFSIILPRYKSV